MRTTTAEDLPQASPVLAAMSGFIMVCLALLVIEVAYLSRNHGAGMTVQPVMLTRSGAS